MDTVFLLVLLPGLFDPVSHECNRNQKIRIDGRTFISGNVTRGLENGTWSSVPERDHLNLECPLGSAIRILDADYGRDSIFCSAKSSFDILHQRCHGKRKCSIYASNREFGDPCRGYDKVLKVKYTCDKVIGEWRRSETACEGEELMLDCPTDTVLVVEDAFYGRQDGVSCSDRDDRVENTRCSSRRALPVVRDRCHLKPNCSVLASNDIFGDPCPHVLKYLRVEYKCAAVFWDIEGRKSATICHKCSGKISCPSGKRILIANAWFSGGQPSGLPCEEKSKPLCGSKNALHSVSKSCNNKEECVPLSHQNTLEEDCVWPQKDLEVEFDCFDGVEQEPTTSSPRSERSADGLQVETVCETHKTTISCAEGEVIRVEEAGYGRQDKTTCPHYLVADVRCRADNSFSVISQACNGKQTCTLYSSNSVFGDPCLGTYKYLTVKYSCNPDTLEGALRDDTTEQVCEGSSRPISCPENHVISIRKAMYGRIDSKPCPGHFTNVTNCVADSTFSLVSERCNGFKTCLLESKNALYGDPCVLTTKYLEVEYDCKINTLEVPQIGDTTEQVCEGSSMSISCPLDHVISIRRAVYGRNDSKPCPGQKTHVTNCVADSTFSLVSERCNGFKTCLLESKNALYGDPCVGTTKYLEVEYDCKRSTLEVSQRGDNTEHVCEWSSRQITCPEDHVISIKKAIYGRIDNKPCPGQKTHVTNCVADSTFSLVSERCNGFKTCLLESKNALYGDPCVGTTKYLEVEYDCKINTLEVPQRGDNTEQVCEWSSKQITCPEDRVISIRRAMYGRNDSKPCPGQKTHVTNCVAVSSFSLVSERCNGFKTCLLESKNALYGDPCVGTTKYLEVEYDCKRSTLEVPQRGDNTEHVCEWSSRQITCPEDHVISIRKAMYGRNDSKPCPGQKTHVTNCVADSSFSLVSERCNGFKTCLLESKNALFGDPCVGTTKYLEVEYDCKRNTLEVPQRGDNKEQVCEWSSRQITCPEDHVISIRRAMYGRNDSKPCPGQKTHVTNCVADSTFSLVSDRCNGFKTCLLESKNVLYGDPCVGTTKYLEVEYDCKINTLEVPQKGDTTEQVCEGSSMSISCPLDHVISIRRALYGRNDSKPCSGQKTHVTNCVADSAFSLVSERCNGFKTCLLESKNALYGDPCVGTTKYLEVEYDCKRSTLEVPQRGDTTKPVCEWSSRQITCPEDHVISIRRAMYGRNDSKPCPGQKTHVTNCVADSTFSLVSEWCNGSRTCLLESSNALYGDPCVGTTKYLLVEYDCKRGAKDISKPHYTEVQRVEIDEHQTRMLQCPGGSIKIVDAAYGKDSCRAESSFRIVSSQCNHKESCLVYAKNEIFGDPCVGTIKKLIVSYQCRTVNPEVRNVVTAEEHRIASLECPVGTAVLVHSASYGQVRQRGSDSVLCSSETAFSTVSNICNMQRKCIVNATNDVISDPCPGIKKELKVKYECVQVMQYHYKEIKERKTATLSCPKGSSILVSGAVYGLPTGPSHDPLSSAACASEKSSDAVSARCNYMSSCQLSSSNSIFDDPCRGNTKTLLIEYRCIKDVVNRGRACEHSILEMDCPDDTRINVVSARYGRAHPYVCSSSYHSPKGCACDYSTTIVYRTCQGKSYCTVPATNNVFDDPCRGIEKYLDVEYECVGSYSVDNNPVESILPENSLRNVSFYLKNINENNSKEFLAQIKKSSENEWKTVLFGRDFREPQTIVGLEPDFSYDFRVLHKDQTSDQTCHSSVTVTTWPWIDIK